MKRLILLIAGFVSLHAAVAESPAAPAPEGPPLIDTLSNEPYLLADPMPSFNGGGTLDFCRWVQERLRYPLEAVIYGIEGHVAVSFVVEADGTVSSVRIIQSPDPILSREVVRVLAESPKWTPGSKGGEPVRVKYTLPVDFRAPVKPAGERKMEFDPSSGRYRVRP